MTAPDRRAFIAATAASFATPAALGAKECPSAGMDWITMIKLLRCLASRGPALHTRKSLFGQFNTLNHPVAPAPLRPARPRAAAPTAPPAADWACMAIK